MQLLDIFPIATVIFTGLGYRIKYQTTNEDIGNILIFWCVTLVLFGNFTLTTWLSDYNTLTEKILISCLFIGPLSIVKKHCNVKKYSIFSIFTLLMLERENMKKSMNTGIEKKVFYFIQVLLVTGIILLMSFMFLRFSYMEESKSLPIIINLLTILIDWGTLFILAFTILKDSHHIENKQPWIYWLYAGISFIIYQYLIKGSMLLYTSAPYVTINSIICSTVILRCIYLKSKKIEGSYFRFNNIKDTLIGIF